MEVWAETQWREDTSKTPVIQHAITVGTCSLICRRHCWNSPGEIEVLGHLHSSAKILKTGVVCHQKLRRKSSIDLPGAEEKVPRCVSKVEFPRDLQRKLQRREI